MAIRPQAQTEEERRREIRETSRDAEGSTAEIRRSGTARELRPTSGSAMPETEGRLFVRKSDGSMESFSREKLARSLVGAGAGQDDADEIAENIRQRIRPGITTADIADIVIVELSGRNSTWMHNYVAWQTSHQTAPHRKHNVP